jgi:hypothetical protein
MRAPRSRAWVTSALALSLLAPSLSSPRVAQADRGPRRSLASCASFTQQDKGDAALELTVRNACSIPIACALAWRVTCAPASKRQRVIPGAARLSLAATEVGAAEASAALCGEDAWTIDRITWSCQPSP